MTVHDRIVKTFTKDRLVSLAKAFKKELVIYSKVIRDKQTPILGKIFLGLAVGYALMPFDLIPDFIPVIGQLDDLVIIPLLVLIGLKFIPKEIVDRYRKEVNSGLLNLNGGETCE